MRKTTNKQANWKSRIYLLVSELLVVFIGVYCAFLLDDYREQQRNNIKKRKIYQSLIKETYQTKANLDQLISVFDSVYFDPFIQPYKNGRMPQLKPLLIGSVGISTRHWEAILATGGLDVLDLDLIEDMEDYYFNFYITIDFMRKAEQFTAQVLLPNIDKNRAEFYDIRTKTLKEKYLWYAMYVKGIRSTLHQIQTANDSLYLKLKERSELIE